MQSKYWRVQMAWPDHSPRHFGKFHSQMEAQKWIAEHQWLANQSQEPKEKVSKVHLDVP